MSDAAPPQTCSVEPFRYQATPQAVGEEGASASQINEQYLEDYLNRLRVAICEDLTNGGGGADTFLELEDTPDSYVGQAGKAVRVNALEDALAFFDNTFLELDDAPATYAGQAGNFVVVNGGETGLIFQTPEVNALSFTLNHSTQTAWFLSVATPFIAAVGISAIAVEVGTPTFQLPATGSTLSSRSRMRLASGAVANNNASVRNAGNLTVRLGSAAGEGGLRFCVRIGVETTVANTRFFCGVSAAIGFGNVTLTSRVNVIGFGWDAAIDTQVQILHNDGAGNINRVPLGASFPANDGVSLYDLQIVALPNQAGFSYRVQRMNDGAVATGTVSGEVPAGTQGLTPYIWIHNGGTAASVQVATSFLILNNYD